MTHAEQLTLKIGVNSYNPKFIFSSNLCKFDWEISPSISTHAWHMDKKLFLVPKMIIYLGKFDQILRHSVSLPV